MAEMEINKQSNLDRGVEISPSSIATLVGEIDQVNSMVLTFKEEKIGE